MHMIAPRKISTTRRSKRPEIRHVPILVSLDDIHPSPENDDLYIKINTDDPDFRELVESIRQFGVLDPLVLTLDNYVISGHRRRMAAMFADLEFVPVRYENIRRSDDPSGYVRLLREHNRQRIKTNGERLREEIVSVNAEDAYVELMEYRERSEAIDLESINIIGTKTRAKISRAKAPLLDAIKWVLKTYREFLPVSDRWIHYQLLNAPPLIHASKPGSGYRNDHKSYKALVELLTRARICGEIAMGAIADETRPVTRWPVHQEPGTYARKEIEGFLKGYWRDLMQSQPNHIELLCEKNTSAGIIRDLAREYTIPMTSGRGYCSLPPRAEMVQRFRASGKSKLVMLIVSDFDPDGEEIAHSLARSLRDDFEVPGDRLVPIKVALTAEQVRQYNLPPNLEAKTESTNFEKFAAKYGPNAYELEAMPLGALKDVSRAAIDSAIDRAAFEHEVEREKQDAKFLEAVRRRGLAALQGIVRECEQ
jgi:ParB-like chromosome segregation protein Spo0J